MNKHRCFVESFRDFHGNIRSQMISVDNIFWDSPLIFTENPLSFFFQGFARIICRSEWICFTEFNNAWGGSTFQV